MERQADHDTPRPPGTIEGGETKTESTVWLHFPNLKVFAERLWQEARQDPGKRNPRYVETVASLIQQGASMDSIVQQTQVLWEKSHFKQKPLERILSLDMCIRKILLSLGLLSWRPPEQYLQAQKIKLGSWVELFYCSSLIWIEAALEQAESLTRAALREFKSCSDRSQRKATEDKVLSDILRLREGFKSRRYRYAHGGGWFDALSHETLWGAYLLLYPSIDDVAASCVGSGEDQERRLTQLTEMGKMAFNAIEATFSRLNEELGW